MNLTSDLEKMGFCLADMRKTDLDDFLGIDKLTYQRYIDEYPDYFGRKYKPEIGTASFHQKMKFIFFKKLLLNNEVVGFMNYDQKDDKIEDISIRIIEKAQNKGIGTLFLSHLIKAHSLASLSKCSSHFLRASLELIWFKSSTIDTKMLMFSLL